jgi:hypothetical protein
MHHGAEPIVSREVLVCQDLGVEDEVPAVFECLYGVLREREKEASAMGTMETRQRT